MSFKINQLFVFLAISLGAFNVLADSTSLKSYNSTDLPSKISNVTQNLKEVNISVNTESLVNPKPSEPVVKTKDVSTESSAIRQTVYSTAVPVSVPRVASTTSKPIIPTSVATTTPSVPFIEESIPRYDAEVLNLPTTSDIGRWVVRNTTTNITCIIVQMTMQLNITYPTMNNQVGNATIKMPVNNTTLNGSCSDSSQFINIKWGANHSLQINFAVNDSAKDFFVSGFTLKVNASIFNDADTSLGLLKFENNETEFLTPLEMSYKCDKERRVNLTSLDPKLPAILTLKNTQLEAYMNSSKTEFGAAQDCEFFDTPDIVPIAVGCALAILVLVVLVAYLIGRKRSQNRGYLSM